MIALPELIDHAMPYRGECGICGDDDARHRTLDAIAARLSVEDSVEETAADFGLTVEVVEAIGEHWNEIRQTWLAERHVCENRSWTTGLEHCSLARCSCGWERPDLFAFRNAARRAWRRHLERAK